MIFIEIHSWKQNWLPTDEPTNGHTTEMPMPCVEKIIKLRWRESLRDGVGGSDGGESEANNDKKAYLRGYLQWSGPLDAVFNNIV